MKTIKADHLQVIESPSQDDEFDKGICIVLEKGKLEMFMFVQPSDTDDILNELLRIRKKHNVDNSKLLYI